MRGKAQFPKRAKHPFTHCAAKFAFFYFDTAWQQRPVCRYRYKRPRKIIFADVPRNPTGKIEKPKLREKYCGVRLVEAQNRG